MTTRKLLPTAHCYRNPTFRHTGPHHRAGPIVYLYQGRDWTVMACHGLGDDRIQPRPIESEATDVSPNHKPAPDSHTISRAGKYKQLPGLPGPPGLRGLPGWRCFPVLWDA